MTHLFSPCDPRIRTSTIAKMRRYGLLAVLMLSLVASACGVELHDAPLEKTSQALSDTSTPVGTWYLRSNGYRNELVISATSNGYTGTIKNEGGAIESLSNVTWDATGRWLEFRRNGSGYYQWFRLSLTYGVMAGRFSHGTSGGKPPRTSYAYHVTGWSPTWLDTGIVPRTWDITINGTYAAVLRVDYDANGVLRGRIKVYDNKSMDHAQEELENDLPYISWNGTNIAFTRSVPGFIQTYQGIATGRHISGTFLHNGSAAGSWSGTRSQVLGFGLGSRLSQRSSWQEATRARILNLTEGMRLPSVDVPAVQVTTLPCYGCPFLNGYYSARDDNPNAWSTNYTLKKLRFSIPLGSRFDPANPPPARVFEGYLATPNTFAPNGFRAVVVVNGHGGSAEQLMSSNSIFWHGESAARRSFVVLAIDIGHRHSWNSGPIKHPAIVDTNYNTSNWEEDGERAFQVRRAIDYLASLPFVRKDRIFLQGLSMGGEVTTITAALDPRVAMATSAGFSPDMHVMDNHNNHKCYLWKNADIHEYIDVSDYQALIAPRPLVVQTGLRDWTYSPLPTPWAADKQITRRARAAYGPDASRLIHYLHDDEHKFRIGDVNPNPSYPYAIQGIRAASLIDSTDPNNTSWQTSNATTLRSPSLYHLMNEFLP